MHTKLSALLLIFLAIIPLFAYDSDIKNEILAYDDTELEILIKSRKLIKTNLAENNLVKVSEITEYLEEKYINDHSIALFPEERVLLHAILGDYNMILTIFDEKNDYFKTGFEELINKNYPPNDWLFNSLKSYLGDDFTDLKRNILNSELIDYKQEFCFLLILYLMQDEDTQFNQQKINNQADLYLAKYPQSYYEEYVRYNIRYALTLGNWGLGFDFFTGYGQFNNNLAEYFGYNIPLGVAFDIFYKDFTLYLRDYIGVGVKTKQAFEYKGYWKKDLHLTTVMAEASVGYPFFENERIKLSPFGGISGISISKPNSDEDNEKELELKMVLAYNIGFNLDFKMGSKCGFTNDGISSGYWFIRLRGGYTIPDFDRLDSRFSGGMIYLNLGMGGFGRRIVRDF